MKSKTENTDSSLYLKEAHLSGYKSIKDVKIDFKNGLNIIIGKNAVGKTNFLTFLSKVLTNSYDKLFLNFSSCLIFNNSKKVAIFKNREKSEILDKNKTKILEKGNVKTKIEVDGEEIQDIENKITDEKLAGINIIYNSTFIYHGIPDNYYLIDSPFSHSYDKGSFSIGLFTFAQESTPYVLKNLFTKISDNFIFRKTESEKFISKIIEESINEIIIKIKSYIIKYSPIQDFRLNKNYNIFTDSDKERYTINNLFFEFKIENNWHPFSNLSDGTKRLFYIISEVAYSGNIHFRNFGSIAFYDEEVNKIILLEEPELGIHPHQLHNLMTFLKEMSRDRQIIISTHSPQVLNILEKDELDRIIIASSKGKEGTKMRHLNEEEILKAQKYMEEDFLSDYWIHSDLEKE